MGREGAAIAAAGTVEVDVLGPLRVRVGADDVTEALPEQLRSLVGALALAPGPIDKRELAREVLFLSPSSIDARLSRLRAALGLPRPVHRVAPARSGRIELDRRFVRVDADGYRAAVTAAAEIRAAGPRVAAIVDADGAWRGAPYGWRDATERMATDPVTAGRRALVALRRDAIADACRLVLHEAAPIDPHHLERWTVDHPDLGLAWFTRVVLVFDRTGAESARRVMDEWPAAGPASADARLREWAARLLAHGRPRSLGEGTPVPVPVPVPIGREAIAADLGAVVDRARGGDHPVAVIEGVAGSGKTRLLDHIAGRGRRAHLVVGIADADERYGLPALVRTALDPVWQAALRDPEPSPGLRRRAAAIALLLDPDPVVLHTPTRAPVDPVPHATQLVEELVRSVTERRPVLLCFDNAHRAPQLLEPLVRALAAARIPGLGVLVTSREPFLADPPAATIHRSLGDLDADAIRRLVATVRGGEPRLTPFPRTEAGTATPLMVLAADRDAGAGPASLREVFEARPPTVRRALALAGLAARGTRCRPDLVDAIARDRAVIDALHDEAARGRIIGWDGDELAFAHRAWPELAVDALDPVERGHLHGLAAQHLDAELSRATDPATVQELAYDLAEHARQCGGSPLARSIATHALMRSAQILAATDPGQAITIYGYAADTTAEPALLAPILRARAALRWQTTDWAGTRADLARARDLAEAAGDLETLSEALLLRAHVTWGPDESRGLESDLLGLLGRLPADAPLLRTRVTACLAGGLYQDGSTSAVRVEQARAALDELDRLATPPHQAVEAELLWWIRKGLLDVARPRECAALAARMEASAGDSTHLRGNAVLAQIVDHLTMARVADARAYSARYVELARTTDAPIQRYMTATLDGVWGLYDGRFADVALATSEAEQLGTFGGITATQVIEGQRVCLARDRGEFRTHPTLVGLVEAVTPVDGAIPVWSAAVAWLHAETSDTDAALEQLRGIAARTEHLAALPPGPHRLPFLSFLAETLATAPARRARDRRFATELARATYDALVAHRATGVLLGWPVVYLGAKERYLGLAAVVAGAPRCAAAHLGRARKLDGSGRPLSARNDLALARLAQATGDGDGARRHATRALRTATRLGLTGVAADAAALA
jgi:hypothetical protein